MKKPSDFIVRTAAFSSGTAAFMVGQLVFMTLLARFGDPVIFGAYTLATALLNPLFFLARMGMRSAQATETSGELAFQSYRSLQFVLIVFAMLATLGMIRVLETDEVVTFVLLTIAVAKVAETVSDLHYGLFLRYQKQQDIAVSLISRAVLSILFFVLMSILFGPKIAMLGLPLSWLMVLIFHDLVRAQPLLEKEEKKPHSVKSVAFALKLLFPLALAGFFGQLAMSVPRYVIGFNVSTEILGQIGPALMAHVFVNTFAQSISQSLLPGISENMKNNEPKRAWNRMLRVAFKLLPLVLFGIVVSFLFGPFLVRLVFGPNYELAGIYLGLVSLSWSFRAYGNLFGDMILGTRRFILFFVLQAIGFVIYLILVIALWSQFGLDGVIYGIILGSLIFLLMAFFVAFRLSNPAVVAGVKTDA